MAKLGKIGGPWINVKDKTLERSIHKKNEYATTPRKNLFHNASQH